MPSTDMQKLACLLIEGRKEADWMEDALAIIGQWIGLVKSAKLSIAEGESGL